MFLKLSLFKLFFNLFEAFIAETVDTEQCIDLYRHSAELINHVSTL